MATGGPPGGAVELRPGRRCRAAPRAALSSCASGGAVELSPGQIEVVRRARRLGGRPVKHTAHEAIVEGHGRRAWQRVWTTTELSQITEASK